MTQNMMKAVLLHGYGDVTRFSYEDAPMPVPASGEVLAKTIAVSINPVDWKIRRGDLKEMMPINFPAVLGRDLSGEVLALGEGVTDLKIGEQVFGLVDHSYAEYVVCKAGDIARIPDALDPIDAAALPLVLLTGAQVIEVGIHPRPGETILITGAMGGVGRTAVHVANMAFMSLQEFVPVKCKRLKPWVRIASLHWMTRKKLQACLNSMPLPIWWVMKPST